MSRNPTALIATTRFTHVDPFEDTERVPQGCRRVRRFGFTHVDPFEDTESPHERAGRVQAHLVSPTSIRSRILKAHTTGPWALNSRCFTHVDPFEDTESRCRSRQRRLTNRRFTHVDPFEDTERPAHTRVVRRAVKVSPTSIRSRILKGTAGRLAQLPGVVSPTSIRSRILKGPRWRSPDRVPAGFTHVDPFEDTERPAPRGNPRGLPLVSPTSIRSRILKGRCPTSTA